MILISREMQSTKVISLIILAGSLLFSCGKKDEKSTEKVIRPIKYSTITKAGSGDNQIFSGVAQASKEAAVSFKVSGTINKIHVKVGDQIRKGQLIASIDATDYTVQYDQAVAQLKSAETQIKSAQAQLVNSRSTYDRAEKLYENNSVPLSEYQQSKAALEAAESQYDAAVAQVTASEAQVTSARNQVSYTRLVAPFSGIINVINVEENEQVGAGNPVAVLSAEIKPEVLVNIPEIFITRVDRGDSVEIEFSAPASRTFKGHITEVGFGSGGGGTYPATVQITDPDQSIRPGMSASVSFNFGAQSPDRSLLVAAVEAVAEGTDGHFVFKLEKEGANYRAMKQPVQIGSLFTEGFEITGGLSEGDLVATAGLKSLLHGMEVKLMPE